MQQDFAQTVKQQANIVRIVGEYVRLKKAGAQNYSGLCPFHGEKTPSFSVHATRQFYHCFGCGQSGDVFAFIQKIESVTFPEAVKLVAQKCGIPLPKRDFASPEEAMENRQRGKLLELHELATAWFQEQLQSPEAARAREYLAGRGLSPEAIAKFRIGYAPDSFSALRDRLQGMAEPELLQLSGLLSAKQQPDGSQGPLYARFRKRIVFPIHNESGRVIAFTARALDNEESSGPKYLNSPETPLYSKGQVLFNLDKARQAIRQVDFAVLVEGQMDCITAYMAGIQNVLATSGTAFTEMQARLLGRYSKRLLINFDPDAAGANAAEKSIALLIEEGFEVKVITLEGGLDPDRFIRERGIDAYAAAIEGAKRHSDYLIERAIHLFPRPENKSKAIHYLLPHIRRVPDRFARDDFASNAAQKLGIDSALVREELKQAARKRKDQIGLPGVEGLKEAERIFLRALAAPPVSRVFLHASQALGRQPEYFENLASARILRSLAGRELPDALTVLQDTDERALLAQILLRESEETGLNEVDAAVDTLKHLYLERCQRRLRQEIAVAERSGDWALVASRMAEKLKIDREIHSIDEAGTSPAGG